jgi:hypothetical protein
MKGNIILIFLKKDQDYYKNVIRKISFNNKYKKLNCDYIIKIII